MEEIKEKHKGDQEKIAMATLALYKEEKVNPFGSCLPLLIQLPILIAIYSVVQGGISHQHEFLLYPFFQNLDTSIINTNFLGILELTQVNIYVLPFLVGGLQFLQTKLAMGKSKSNNKSSSEMEVATKTMTYTMPVMIAIFTASAPAGVGLYWLFNTLYAIIQQLFVNKQVDQQSTSIRLADQDRHKSKKEEYAAKQQARLAQKAAQETKSTESSNDHQDDDHDDHQDPPIIKIKA